MNATYESGVDAYKAHQFGGDTHTTPPWFHVRSSMLLTLGSLLVLLAIILINPPVIDVALSALF